MKLTGAVAHLVPAAYASAAKLAASIFADQVVVAQNSAMVPQGA